LLVNWNREGIINSNWVRSLAACKKKKKEDKKGKKKKAETSQGDGEITPND